MPDNNALHNAASAGNLADAQSQVNNFDVNAIGKYDETAVFKAAEGGYLEIVKLLLTWNANVNIPNVRTLTIDVTC